MLDSLNEMFDLGFPLFSHMIQLVNFISTDSKQKEKNLKQVKKFAQKVNIDSVTSIIIYHLLLSLLKD